MRDILNGKLYKKIEEHSLYDSNYSVDLVPIDELTDILKEASFDLFIQLAKLDKKLSKNKSNFSNPAYVLQQKLLVLNQFIDDWLGVS